jgi:hypothetical protein
MSGIRVDARTKLADPFELNVFPALAEPCGYGFADTKTTRKTVKRRQPNVSLRSL